MNILKVIRRYSLLLALLAFAPAAHAEQQNAAPAAPVHNTDDWLTPRIGTGYGVQVKEGRTSDRELAKIKEAGFSYVRFVVPWYEVEKNGAFVWGYFDSFVKRLRRHGLGAVIVLGAGHPAYTKEEKAPAGNLDHAETMLHAPKAAPEIEAFSRYAAKTVAHFDGPDIIWELWNEPDSDRFWAPRANVNDYTAVMSAACRAIRKEKPSAKIVGPGMAEMAGQWGTGRAGFLGAVLRSPLSTCLDAVSMHPYRDYETPPETVLPAYDKLRAFVKAHTPKGAPLLPVLSTEWGFSLTDVSEEEQAAFALRSLLLSTLAGAPVAIWYEWRDARRGDSEDTEAHFGLLTLREREKPAFKAVRNFFPPLKGARIEARLKTGDKDHYVLLLRKPDKSAALAFWTRGVGADGERESENEAANILVTGCKAEPQKIALTGRPATMECEGPAHTVKAGVVKNDSVQKP